jgi:hypothetical protein
MSECYVFWPRTRVLADLILFWFVAILIAVIAEWLPLGVLLIVGGGWAFLFSMLWFLWIRPVFKIVVREGKIFGPSMSFKRVAFPLRRLDHGRLLRRTPKQKWIGYRILWSLDGERILMWHKLLGKLAGYEIMEIIEKYPFRESADAPAKDRPGKN